MFQTKVVEEVKTHIYCSIIFFEIEVFMAKCGKNMVDPYRPQMKI